MSDASWDNINRLYYLTDRLERIQQIRRNRLLLKIALGVSLLTMVGAGSYLYINAIF